MSQSLRSGAMLNLPTTRLLLGVIALLYAPTVYSQIPVGTIQPPEKIIRGGTTIAITTQTPLYPDDVILEPTDKPPTPRLFDTSSTHLEHLPAGGFRVVQQAPPRGKGLGGMVAALVGGFISLPAAVQQIGWNGKVLPKSRGPVDPVVPHPAARSMLIPGETVQFQWKGNSQRLRFAPADGGPPKEVPLAGTASFKARPEDIGLSQGAQYKWAAVDAGGTALDIQVLQESSITDIREDVKAIESLGTGPSDTLFMKGCYFAYVTRQTRQTATPYELAWLAYQYMQDSGVRNAIYDKVIADYRSSALGPQSGK